MCAINDPLGQTHKLASSDHYSQLKLFCFADERTDTTCENSDHYRPWLRVGLVDQSSIQIQFERFFTF